FPAVALKGKTFCAPREPQKVLVSELDVLFPMHRVPTSGTVLTASSNPLKVGDLLPFRGWHSTTGKTASSIAALRCRKPYSEKLLRQLIVGDIRPGFKNGSEKAVRSA